MAKHRKSSSGKRFAAEAALGGMMAMGVVMGSAAIAAADPEAPPPPAPSPGANLLQGELDPNMIVGSPPPVNPAVTALGPLGAVTAGGTPDFLLGQNAVPSATGTGNAAMPADVLQSGQFMMPQNYHMPEPDQDSPYALNDDTPPGPFARINGFKGAHALAHGAIGRMPIGELGQPLPGTAPPPGTNIPVGPVEAIPDPQGTLPPLPPLG